MIVGNLLQNKGTLYCITILNNCLRFDHNFLNYAVNVSYPSFHKVNV